MRGHRWFDELVKSILEVIPYERWVTAAEFARASRGVLSPPPFEPVNLKRGCSPFYGEEVEKRLSEKRICRGCKSWGNWKRTDEFFEAFEATPEWDPETARMGRCGVTDKIVLGDAEACDSYESR